MVFGGAPRWRPLRDLRGPSPGTGARLASRPGSLVTFGVASATLGSLPPGVTAGPLRSGCQSSPLHRVQPGSPLPARPLGLAFGRLPASCRPRGFSPPRRVAPPWRSRARGSSSDPGVHRVSAPCEGAFPRCVSALQSLLPRAQRPRSCRQLRAWAPVTSTRMSPCRGVHPSPCLLAVARARTRFRRCLRGRPRGLPPDPERFLRAVSPRRFGPALLGLST